MPTIAAAGAGLALVAAVAAVATPPRTTLPGGGAAARAGSAPPGNDAPGNNGIENALPHSSTLLGPQTPSVVALVPEAPVEALPRAPTTNKARGVGRRVTPAAAPTPSPDTHALGDTTKAEEGAGTLAEPAPPAATTGVTSDADRDHNSGAPATIAPALPAIDPLVKAIHDDIDEEETRRNQ
ncbi:MAG: hypothetical protein ACLP1X_29435 [Polyangiaceae bacterium]